MEVVDMKTVMKSKTMYLSVMPPGSRPPEQLLKSLKCDTTDDDVFLLPRWVMVRERSLRKVKRRQMSLRMSQTFGGIGSDGDLDISRGGLGSPSGRRLLLFFQVGEKWKDLAWALFDGVQTDPETVRMIADIELKNPGRLSDAVQDLMARWWKKKGIEATVDELRDTLDLIAVPYVQEEYTDLRSNFSASFGFDSESEGLDVGEVTETDPNVSRLMRNYKVRSLNASFNRDHSSSLSRAGPPSADTLSRRLKQRGLIPEDSSPVNIRATRGMLLSAPQSRDSTLLHGNVASAKNGSFRVFSSQDSLDNVDSAGEDGSRQKSVRRSRLISDDFRCESNL
jgi:hypothetical protein